MIFNKKIHSLPLIRYEYVMLPFWISCITWTDWYRALPDIISCHKSYFYYNYFWIKLHITLRICNFLDRIKYGFIPYCRKRFLFGPKAKEIFNKVLNFFSQLNKIFNCLWNFFLKHRILITFLFIFAVTLKIFNWFYSYELIFKLITELLIYFKNNFFGSFVCYNWFEYPVFVLFSLFFFLTSFLSLLLTSYLGLYGVFYLNFFSLSLLWFSFIPYFIKIFKYNYSYYINFGKWISLGSNYRINFDFYIDHISYSFSFLTLSIAVFVYVYSLSYFKYEPLADRLIIFLNLFIISMVFLVSSGNLIVMFLGWEMIGLTSFFLINFWATRVGTLKSAFKAFSFNKVSDFFFFLATLLVFNTLYSVDLMVILTQIHHYRLYTINFCFFNISLIDLISALFLMCAFIKSAQIGFHIWLPDSMEAPVPASALIHSATLVSAGIFILLRFYVIFELSSYALQLISVVGSMTAFYGGFISMFQSDNKRILAYSTISHCGFLMVSFSTGVYQYTLLYLYIHGFFKAMIFMSIGNVNRFSRNSQDIRKMGCYYKYLPFDCFLCFIGLVNLSGLPFSLGFYVKHLLINGLNSSSYLFYLVLTNCLLGALTGLVYSYRLFFYIFFDFKKGKKKLYQLASKKTLYSSNFYSNTTIAGNFAIIGLLLTSYIISFYLYYIFFIDYINFDNSINYNLISHFIENFASSKNYLFNISYFSWIVLILIHVLIFSHFRKSSIKLNYLDSFIVIVILYFFFFIFFFILS